MITLLNQKNETFFNILLYPINIELYIIVLKS
jgi:hypothetical protein